MARTREPHRIRSLVVGVAVLSGGVMVVPGSTVAVAVAPNPPVLDILKAGQVAAGVVEGDSLTARLSAPVDATGATNVEIKTSWLLTTGSITQASDVTAPAGWTKTFTTDGTNYVANPANWSQVIGAKAVGSVPADGFTAATQVNPLGSQGQAVASSGDVRPTLASFQGSSAGDGWNIFHGLGNVYNFYHHGGDGNWTTGIDCHNRVTSASCWTGKPNTSSGALILTYGQFISAPRSWGYVDATNQRAWGFFKRGVDNKVGFLCFDVSSSGPRLCPDVGASGFIEVSSTAVGSWEGLGDMEFFDGKLWARTHDANSGILCMVVASATPCVGQPFSPAQNYSAPGGDRLTHRNRIFGGRMYFTSGNTQMDCVDLAVATPVRCGGSWPVTTASLPANINFRFPIFAVTSGNGSVIGKVCAHHSLGGDNNVCVTTEGVVTASVASLPGTGGYSADGWGDNFNYKDRYYYNRGDDRYGCWDFTLNAGAGGQCSQYQNPQSLGNSVYMVSADPEDENCLWSNGHSGKIQPFNALTGVLNCAPVGPTVDFKTPTIVSRLPCASSSAVRSWKSLTVTPPDVSQATGVNPANAKLTVLVGGVTALNSWTNVVVSSSTATTATFDLSSLSVAASGLSPTFAVTWPVGSISGTTGVLKYESDPAQLCVNLTVKQACPGGNGQSATATFAGVNVLAEGSTTIGAGQPVAVDNTANAADNANCLGTAVGTLTDGGQPISGATVTLVAADSSLIKTTTNAQGQYTIPRLFPGTYPIVFGPIDGLGPTQASGSVTIVRTQSTTKNGAFDANALRAPDIVKTVSVGSTATFDITGTGAAIDSSLTRFIDPADSTAVTSLSSSGQPAWSLTNGTPTTAAFNTVGTYYAVYRISTTGGAASAQGLLTLKVENPVVVVPPVPVTTVPATTVPATGSTTPSTTRPPNPPVTVTLAPNGPGVLPEIPPGRSLVTEGGAPVDAKIEKIADATWQMTGRGFQWQMEIPALGDQAGSSQGVVTLVTDREVEISGFGFKEESLVDLWLFSTPVFIGTVRVDKNGNFVDELKVPSNIKPGLHTLQANGVTPDNVIRSLNLGVQVIPPPSRLPITGSSSTPIAETALWIVVSGVLLDAIRRRRGLIQIRR